MKQNEKDEILEMLDVVDESGKPTGETVDRITAHAEGIRHRTSHVWIVRKKGTDIEVLLQKRSDNKDSHPGCYDISSAGHIPAGDDYLLSAQRELQEELGIDIEKEELLYCGQRSFEFQDEFYGHNFHDNQISNVYILWIKQDIDHFILQKEEVSEVRWYELNDCIEKIKNNEIPNCIHIEELEMVKRRISQQE